MRWTNRFNLYWTLILHSLLLFLSNHTSCVDLSFLKPKLLYLKKYRIRIEPRHSNKILIPGTPPCLKPEYYNVYFHYSRNFPSQKYNIQTSLTSSQNNLDTLMIPYQEKLLPMLDYTTMFLKKLGKSNVPNKWIFINKKKYCNTTTLPICSEHYV